MNSGKGVAAIFSIVVAAVVAAQQGGFPILEGRFLGQDPPGLTPEVFAPGIVSTEAIEASLCFSYDDRFLVFRRGFREDTEIYLSELDDGVWTEAVNLGSEINSEESENRPFITADGKYLFFNSSANESRDVFWVDLGVVEQLRPVSQ